jgi:hypothetical protein
VRIDNGKSPVVIDARRRACVDFCSRRLTELCARITARRSTEFQGAHAVAAHATLIPTQCRLARFIRVHVRRLGRWLSLLRPPNSLTHHHRVHPNAANMTTITPSLPLVLEDRTGHAHGTDFDDAYDRLFLRVVEPRTDVCGDATGAPRALAVYDMPQRWAPRRAGAHAVRAPAAVLRLGPRGALGDVEFRTQRLVASLPVHTWMPRTGFFAACVRRALALRIPRSRRPQASLAPVHGVGRTVLPVGVPHNRGPRLGGMPCSYVARSATANGCIAVHRR